MIAPDKRKHFVCALIMDFCLLVLFYLLQVKGGFWYANGITLLFWIGKEVYDCYKLETTGIIWLDKILKPLALIGKPTGFSFGDIVADLVGMGIANIIYVILIA